MQDVVELFFRMHSQEGRSRFQLNYFLNMIHTCDVINLQVNEGNQKMKT